MYIKYLNHSLIQRSMSTMSFFLCFQFKKKSGEEYFFFKFLLWNIISIRKYCGFGLILMSFWKAFTFFWLLFVEFYYFEGSQSLELLEEPTSIIDRIWRMIKTLEILNFALIKYHHVPPSTNHSKFECKKKLTYSWSPFIFLKK